MSDKASANVGACEGFLESVARAYLENFDDLSEFCFVFPNKRSGTFFLRALSRLMDRHVLIAPDVKSISDFTEYLSGRTAATRIDLLFRLYGIYRKMNGGAKEASASGDDSDLLDFDAFRGWGEILLADFSEVDQYDVDADRLFVNVSDFREISSNFLTEEQTAILEKYFGYTPSRRDVESFWKNLVPPEGLSDIKSRFMYLWQMMGPLYHALNDQLAEAGLATPGGIYRIAARRVEEFGAEIFPWKKVVFVGFNALSTTEALLFEQTRKAAGYREKEKDSFADFFWDATGPVLESSESDAASFLRLNRRNFPSPDWAQPYMEMSRRDSMPPDIRVVASPSNSAQAKLASARVAEILDSIGDENMQDAKVAVVLPDENLLLPLLYSLPERLGAVNLTMGYSLRLTSVASFLHHLRRLHARERRSGGKPAFYHEDLRMLMSHPFAHALFGSKGISALNAYMTLHHRLAVTLPEISGIFSDSRPTGGMSVEDILYYDPVTFGEGTQGGIAYIDNVLAAADTALAGRNSGVVKSRIDRSHIALYRDALRRLERSASEHSVEMSLAGVFYMVDKLLAGEHVTFEGEPLEGLQVMGLLETRAIDFEHLVIPSMNDRIMPRKSRHATFIPDALRRGYGLPYANYQEGLFSYYFYRMISRAKSVTLIYDARSGDGMRSGGESRYLMQLRYLHARGKIRFENHRFMLSEPEGEAKPVEKSPEVMRKIEAFAEEGSKRNFSASALRKYGECQVKFFFEVIENLRTDDTPDDFIDPITQGNIIHDTMLRLYFPEKLQRKYLPERIVMKPETFDALLADRERIAREVVRAVNKQHFKRSKEEEDTPLEGSARMVASHLERQVREIIAYDRTLAPLHLAGGEMEGLVRWEYEPGKAVNMKYAIDRLDILNPGGNDSVAPGGANGGIWRIVDYKTGASLVEGEGMESVFNGDPKAKNIFQLLLYANVMNRDLGLDEDVRVAIYEVNRLRREGERLPVIDGTRLAGHKAVNDRFLAGVNSMIADIFNPAKPFEPTSDPDHCTYCKLQDLCGKGN